ncbi:MAG: DUF6456 domain-containing protein [Aestuariivirga sp.]
MSKPYTDRAFARLSRQVLRRLKLASPTVLVRGNLGWQLAEDQGGEPIPADLIAAMAAKGLLASDGPGRIKLPHRETKHSVLDCEGAESPLLRLHRRSDPDGRPLISAMQFAAGEKLRTDYSLAHFERRTTVTWDMPLGAAPGHASLSDNRIANLTDASIAARQRVHLALDAVGPELAGSLYYVCCLASGIEQAERMLQLPARSVKAVLALALTRLARHYRLMPRPPSNRNAGTITRWGLADFRPEIAPPAQPAPRP